MVAFPPRRRSVLPPPAELCAWRTRRLRAAGFEPDLASRVAADPDYDMHALLELVERGCPPELAARIEAPLESDEPW